MFGLRVGDGCFRLVANLRERFRVVDRDFGKHFPVDLDVGEFQTMHQTRVGKVVHAGSGVDTRDPDLAHVSFQFPTVVVCVFERMHYLLVRCFI